MVARTHLKERLYALLGRDTTARRCGISECGKRLERTGKLSGGRIVEYQTGMGTPRTVTVCHDCAVDLRTAQMADDSNPHAR